jgi:hypothetical protein
VLERIDTTDAAIAAGSNGNGRDRGPRAASGMAPRATGAIETHEWRDGRTVTVRARLRAYGRRYRIAFGTNHEGWSVERARVELDRILQHVERGTWDPPSRADNSTAALEGDETVHVTASRWWQRRNAEPRRRRGWITAGAWTTCSASSRTRRPPSSTSTASMRSAASSRPRPSRHGAST